jgi:hypothetical protein
VQTRVCLHIHGLAGSERGDTTAHSINRIERGDTTELGDAAAEVSNLVRSRAMSWLASVDSDPGCDYVETRTGGEVILLG